MESLISCQSCGASIDRDELVLRELSHCPSCGEKLNASYFNESKLAALEVPIKAPPQGSRIEIIEADNQRLMISIPPGGRRSRSLGCFAVVWNLISVTVFTVFLFAGLNQPDFPPVVVLIPGFFLLIGAVMVMFWIRMRFQRGYLYLEPTRAVMQTILFNRKKNREVTLDEASQAELVVSYTENESPVHRVDLKGVGGTLGFGTSLERNAKDWYVATLNTFLDWHHHRHRFQPETSRVASAGTSGEQAPRDRAERDGPTRRCPSCLRYTQLPSEQEVLITGGQCRCEHCDSWLTVEANEITEAIPLRMDRPDAVGSELPFRLEKTGGGDWLMTVKFKVSGESAMGLGCLLMFAIFWESFVIFWTWGVAQAPGLFKYGMLLFSLPFHAIGLGMLAVGLFALFGKSQLLLGRDESWSRWALGPLRYTKRFHTDSITHVKLVRGSMLRFGTGRHQDISTQASPEALSCVLVTAGHNVSVTQGHHIEEAGLAAGLVRYCLNDLGIRLQDD
jgi:hypothetical protein